MMTKFVRQFVSYLLLPSLSVLSETFVDLSCLARHSRQHKIDTIKKIPVFSKFMVLCTKLKSKWPMLENRHGFYALQVKYFYLAIMNFVSCKLTKMDRIYVTSLRYLVLRYFNGNRSYVKSLFFIAFASM